MNALSALELKPNDLIGKIFFITYQHSKRLKGCSNHIENFDIEVLKLVFKKSDQQKKSPTGIRAKNITTGAKNFQFNLSRIIKINDINTGRNIDLKKFFADFNIMVFPKKIRGARL